MHVQSTLHACTQRVRNCQVDAHIDVSAQVGNTSGSDLGIFLSGKVSLELPIVDFLAQVGAVAVFSVTEFAFSNVCLQLICVHYAQ